MKLEITSSVSESGAKQVRVNVGTQPRETILHGSMIGQVVSAALFGGNSIANDRTHNNLKQKSKNNGSIIGDLVVALAFVVLSLGGLFLSGPLSVFAGWIAAFLSFAWAIRKFHLGYLSTQPCAGTLSVIAAWFLIIIAILLAAFTLTVFMGMRC